MWIKVLHEERPAIINLTYAQSILPTYKGNLEWQLVAHTQGGDIEVGPKEPMEACFARLDELLAGLMPGSATPTAPTPKPVAKKATTPKSA